MTQKENAMHVLVTGAAGFIGFHLSRRLTADGHTVVGIDNLNDYYDVRLKEDRLAQLAECRNFRFEKLDLADSAGMAELFRQERFTHVVNLAAQAGVRYSLINPASYISSNLVGFGNILEGCRQTEVQHLVFASSSSVYGLNTHQPFSEHDNVDHPVSLYAASKKSNELMAHSYSHLFNIPCTGLRFFTVYGPWGRPDMAPFKFLKAVLEGQPIRVFNHGDLQRDFTYIDDIVQGTLLILGHPATGDVPHTIYNIGHSEPVQLMDFIRTIEQVAGRKAVMQMEGMQPGDVYCTYADTTRLQSDFGYRPMVSIAEGLKRFYDWYIGFYGLPQQQ